MLTSLFKHPLMLALGFGLILLAVYLTWRKHHILLKGHLADGEVIELIPHQGSKGGPTYSLRIAYTQPDGNRGEFTTTFSSNPPMHQLNEKVRVVYYPDKESLDILAFKDLYLFPWVLLCAGVFLLMMCAGFAFGPGLVNTIYLPTLGNTDPLKTLNLLK